MTYLPPHTITPAILNLVAEISELIGRYTVLAEQNLTPRLRRENRIRTIQASLSIENNTLTLEQVTAVIDVKRVLGLPCEIREVRNAFADYEAMEHWQPTSESDLLTWLKRSKEPPLVASCLFHYERWSSFIHLPMVTVAWGGYGKPLF